MRAGAWTAPCGSGFPYLFGARPGRDRPSRPLPSLSSSRHRPKPPQTNPVGILSTCVHNRISPARVRYAPALASHNGDYVVFPICPVAALSFWRSLPAPHNPGRAGR